MLLVALIAGTLLWLSATQDAMWQTLDIANCDGTFTPCMLWKSSSISDGVVYKIPCECGKIYIGETGRAVQDRIKEHDRDIRLARTQTSAVSEHANETGHLPIWKEVKFVDRDPHWYTRRVKEAIHIRLHPNNINRDSGIKIPEAWIPAIRKHNSRPTTKRTCEGTTSNSRHDNEDRNAPIATNHHATNSDT